jgi:hypothetical protein
LVERISYQFNHVGRLQASYRGLEALYDDGYQKVKDLDYYYQAIGELLEHDTEPPRWFCPVDAHSPIEDAPVMLYLPGNYAAKCQQYMFCEFTNCIASVSES